MSELAGKVVLITGASRGIGEAAAYEFAKNGCRLALTYLSKPEEARKVESKCRELGAAEVRLYQLDVTKDDEIKTVAATIVSDFSGIDYLINNAGVLVEKDVSEQSFEEIDQQFAVNTIGPIKLTQALLPKIRDGIINIASSAGIRSRAGYVPYCATKFALRGFTQGLSQELPSLKIFAVNPDLTATSMVDFEGRPPEQVAAIVLQTAKDGYGKLSGSDVNVWEILETEPWFGDMRKDKE